MPPVSERQRKAMWAAANGHSTSGIPESVGKEFVSKDAIESPPLAAGVIFIAPDGAVLLLCRSAQEANYASHWALPGGKGEEGETPWMIACREACEEIGPATGHAWVGEPTIVDEAVTPTGMIFTTFVQPVRYRFTPEIDAEHCGYVWATADHFPSPMHPQVARVLEMLFPEEEMTNASDESEQQKETARGKLSERDKEVAEKTPNEREEMPAHVFLEPASRKYPVKSKHNSEWRYDRELLLAAARRARMNDNDNLAAKADAIRNREFANDSIAMDRATVRSKDADGHLRVERTPITRAVVSPYYGREIPAWQELNLDPERVYQVYRDAEELAKGAKSFEGKPVLSDHIASSADNHPKLATVGAVGSPVEMVGDTLYAPLTIWDQAAIDDIESGEKRNLSCSYRYQYDPTPGTAPNGMPFDGRMKAIAGNHVAIVEEPRVPGSMVADNMPAGLAVTTPNSAIPAGGIKRARAHDDKETEMSKAKDRARDEGGLMERLKEKISAEDYKALDEMLNANAAEDEEEEEKKKAEDEAEEEAKKKAEDEEAEAKKKAEDEEEDDKKEKAMDAAIKAATAVAVAAAEKRITDNILSKQNKVRVALDHLRPYVGSLDMAFDSAEDAYREGLKILGVKDYDKIHASALPTILELHDKAGAKPSKTEAVAMDSASTGRAIELAPGLARIKIGA